MGSKSRTKGKSAELEVVNVLRDSGAFPAAARDLAQTRVGENGRDIINTGEWTLQIKRRAAMDRSTVLRGLAEASAAATAAAPLVACVHRGDREAWKVTCDIADLAWFYSRHAWAGTCFPVEMLLSEWCEMVNDVRERWEDSDE
jgi:hypothetical protein